MFQYHVKYIILHRLMPNGNPVAGPEIAALDPYIRTVLGMTPVHEEAAFTIFRNPQVDP